MVTATTHEVVDHGRRLHIVRVATLQTLCGCRSDNRDRYPNPQVGWRVWADRVRQRCRRCEARAQ